MTTTEADHHVDETPVFSHDTVSDDEILDEPTGRRLEISAGAGELLRTWGLNEGEISELAELSGSFEYANLVGKAERIASQPAYLMTDTEGESLVLPNLRDYTGDRKEGQCGEIAIKVIRAMHESDWLLRVNTRLTESGQRPLQPVFSTGKSKTHFTQGESNHVWSGLVQAGTHPDNGVLIDGSFLTISRYDESGYTPEKSYPDPKSFAEQPSIKLRIGTYSETADGMWRLHPEGGAVIGVTSDGALALDMGFVKSEQKGDIRPYIRAWGANEDIKAIFVYQNNGILQAYNPEAMVSPAQQAEITHALIVLSTLQIVPNETTAQAHLNEAQQGTFASRTQPSNN